MIRRLYAAVVGWLYRDDPIPPVTPDMGDD